MQLNLSSSSSSAVSPLQMEVTEGNFVVEVSWKIELETKGFFTNISFEGCKAAETLCNQS